MILQQYASQDFQAYFIIWQNGSFGAPTAQYCSQVRSNNGLAAMTVLYDEGQLAAMNLDERHFHFVMKRGSEIVFRRQFEDTTFEAEIMRLLAE